jgi:20S proteasome alpha/beta subunit
MTIAAGLLTTDGVLVCADRQITAGASKLEGNKIGHFEASWSSVIAAFAGNVAYAATAFQACECAKESANIKRNPIQGLNGLLAKRYREHVFTHPLYKSGDCDFSIIFGIRLKKEKRARLYVTTDTEFREIKSFECVGAGEDAGRNLLKYIYNPRYDLRRGVAVASYAISHVADRVQFCGGAPNMGFIRHDGVADVAFQHELELIALHLANVGNWFAWESQKFLMNHLFGDMRKFSSLVDVNTRAVYIRSCWEDFATGKADLQSTRLDQSRLPPWPE